MRYVSQPSEGTSLSPSIWVRRLGLRGAVIARRRWVLMKCHGGAGGRGGGGAGGGAGGGGHHVDEDVEAAQGTYELLVALHDDPYLRADAAINELRWHQMTRVVPDGGLLRSNHRQQPLAI